MSDDYSQLVAEYNREINMTEKNITVTAMLVMGRGKHIVIADRNTGTIQLRHYQDFHLLNQLKLDKIGRKSITDMTLMDSDTFAVLVRSGFWTDGNIRILNLDEEDCINEVRRFKISKNTSRFCYQEDFFFLTCSPSRRSEHGYVRKVGKDGQKYEKYTVDRDNNTLFGNRLSRIHVDKNFQMFVSDAEKKELTILKINPINRKVTVLTRHRYSIKGIATKLDGTCFLVTSHNNGVILLHANGGWVFNNFLPKSKLNGKPLSVTYSETDKQLLVVIQKSNRLKKSLVLLVFDENTAIAKTYMPTIEN